MIGSVSKRLWLVNLILLAVAAGFVTLLVRDLTRARALPPAPAPPQAQAPTPAEEKPSTPAPDEQLAAYNVIVAKYLFNPSRSEGGSAPAASAAPPPPKPTLLGVVVDGQKSVAYMEDASTKRVFGYKIGDSVSGGRLDAITDDKVVIVRPDGAVDVLLRDPTKPKPAAAPGAPQPATPGQPQVVTPPVPGQRAQPPVPPRVLRRFPVPQPQPQQ
jgi:hypothetical protein